MRPVPSIEIAWPSMVLLRSPVACPSCIVGHRLSRTLAGPMQTPVIRQFDAARGGRDVLLELELRRGQLRKNLRCALREAIQDGRLADGDRLPSSRQLATDLSVSRGVVADTYDQLVAEGYLEIAPRQAPTVRAPAPAPEPDDHDVGPSRPHWPIDFVATTPDVELFPRRAWLRATERTMHDAPNEALDYGDHRGRIELRTALRDYLARVRGVRVTAERIVITQGFTQPSTSSLGRCGRAADIDRLRDAITAVRMGDRAGLRSGARARPDRRRWPADRCPGGRARSGRGRDARAPVPDRRRHDRRTSAEFVTWARRHRRFIIEDDYDAEFRYDRNGIGAIQGLDPSRGSTSGRRRRRSRRVSASAG